MPEITWDEAVELIRSCQVAWVAQTHSGMVQVGLKDGTARRTVEPTLDLVLTEAQAAEPTCGDIQMVTE